MKTEPIHPWRWRALMAWIVIFTVTVLWIVDDLADTRKENCVRIANVLIDIVEPQGMALGQPGTPGYAYYKEHPDELAVAKEQNAALIARLDPSKCQ